MHKIISDYPNSVGPGARELLTFANAGPELIETNYWRSTPAHLGQLFLSRNAGVYRLLVPEPALEYLKEMRTGKYVTIERSCTHFGLWNVWFEDGTDSPWRVDMDPKASMDFAPVPHSSKVAVWTEAGKMFELPCEVVG